MPSNLSFWFPVSFSTATLSMFFLLGAKRENRSSCTPSVLLDQPLASLVTWLRNRHAEVMATEAQALARLDAGDTPGHNELMRRKAELLASMAEDAKPLLEPFPGEARFNYALALEGFSASARMSLRLNSVFYMSALLYPDEHKPGQPDNLTLCIDRMEKLGLEFRQD